MIIPLYSMRDMIGLKLPLKKVGSKSLSSKHNDGDGMEKKTKDSFQALELLREWQEIIQRCSELIKDIDQDAHLKLVTTSRDMLKFISSMSQGGDEWEKKS